AARDGLPILLTTAEDLPSATRDALTALDPAAVTIVGGTAAVATAVADQVAASGAAVDRVAGDGRFDTAVAVALRSAPNPSTVWVASGRNWPDALVAGPAAARTGGVLVLTDPASLQHAPATLTYLDDLRASSPAPTAHLVGGTAVISADVAHTVATGELATPTDGIPRADVDRPPAVPARNTAPPLSAAVPWSDPATWGGRLPQAGEVATIPADTAVLLDIDPPDLRGIQVNGTLTVADRDVTIAADWITVTGHLAIGTPQTPLTADVTVVLDPQPGDFIAGAGEGPIAVHGGTLDIHGTQPTRTWTRLAATAVAGSSTMALQASPGWQPGDQIVIASTSTDPDQAEQRTVTASSGTTVTLDQPLAHTHWGQTDVLAGTPVPIHAEVGNLSRNIVVTSSDSAIDARRGGHVMVFDGSVARISGAEFTGLGQVGELARYPVHFHMMGNASGSWIQGASVHHTFNRCVTFHGSDHVDMVDTVGFESLGHCYFFEDGVETGNTLHCNLGLSTRRPAEGEAILESDRTPATFWISNPANHLTGNAAAGSDSHGFWFDLPEAPTGLSDGVEMDVRRLPLGTFDDNVAHSGADNGWKDGIGIFVEDHDPPTPAIMRRNLAYKFGSFGAWIEGAELHDTILADNGIGFLGLRARLVDATVVGVTSNAGGVVPWRQTGVGFYHQR
ncbi:MAG TPA: G8 domain-containing protein, partial [Euzebya sp.]|nr:G8 domain-containing protein [Euzebya sp.]